MLEQCGGSLFLVELERKFEASRDPAPSKKEKELKQSFKISKSQT